MGIFNNEDTKQDKQQKKLEEYKKKFNLESLNEEDLETIKKISNRLLSSNLLELGSMFGTPAIEQAQANYLITLVEQNWLIIKKLDEISNKLNK